MSFVDVFSSSENVTDALYSMICPMLASRDCIKCVSENNESLFTTDVLCLLSHIDIEHPVGEVILQALEAHKRKYKTGSKTLLFMITRIMKVVIQLHGLGIPVKKSMNIITTCVSQLIEDLKNISIPVSMLQNKQTSKELPSKSTESHHKSHTEINNHSPILKEIEDNDLIDQKKLHEKVSQCGSDTFCHPFERERTELKSTSDCCNGGHTSDFSEADPLVLKMTCVQQSELEDDISWYFIKSSDESRVESRHTPNQDFQNNILSVCEDTFPVSQQTPDKISSNLKSPCQNSIESPCAFASNLCSGKEDIIKDSGGINQLSFPHSSKSVIITRNKNEHDSDFEDCFDDDENRKHSSVKVESLPPLSFHHSEEASQDWLLFHNVKKHFPSATDFDCDRVLAFSNPENLVKKNQNDAPNKNDDEFAACFDGIDFTEDEHNFETAKNPHHEIKGKTLHFTNYSDSSFYRSIKSPQDNVKTESCSGFVNAPNEETYDSSSIKKLNDMLDSVTKRRSLTSNSIERNMRNSTRTQNDNERAYKDRVDQLCTANNHNAHTTSFSMNSHTIIEKSEVIKQTEAEHHHDLLKNILENKQNDWKVGRSHQITISSRYFSDTEANQRPAFEVDGNAKISLSLSQCVPKNSHVCEHLAKEEEEIVNSSLSNCCSSDVNNESGSIDMTWSQLLCQNQSLALPQDTSLFVNTEFSKTVEQILWHQMKDKPFAEFNLKLVNCVYASDLNPTLNLKDDKCVTVLPGIIVPCDVDTLQKLSPFNDMKFRKAVLVKGDLTPFHHHKGYKSTLANKVIVSTAADRGTTAEWAWTSFVLSTVRELNIDIILVKGIVKDTLLDVLERAGVLVFSNTPYQTLNALAYVNSIDMVTYITDACEDHVCDLELQPLSESWMDHLHDEKAAVKHFLKIVNSSSVQTVVLNYSNPVSACIAEEKLWKCLNRLSNAIKDKKVLPGAGRTEAWCAHELKRKAMLFLEDNKGIQHAVLEELSQVFTDFSSLVQEIRYSQQEQDHSKDGLTSSVQAKKEAATAVKKSLASKQILQQEFPQDGLKFASGNGFDWENEIEYTGGPPQQNPYFSSHSNSMHLCDTPSRGSAHSNLDENDIYDKETINCYDNYTSKVASWEAAIDVVSLLSRLESLIITGIDMTSADREFAVI